MSNRTAYTAGSHSFCPFSQFYPRRSPTSKVLAPPAPIVAVRLWVSELPTIGISDSQLESSCPGEQELSFFVSIRPRNVEKTGPSIRPLNDFPRPVPLCCRPFSRQGPSPGKAIIRLANPGQPDPGREDKQPRPIQTFRRESSMQDFRPCKRFRVRSINGT